MLAHRSGGRVEAVEARAVQLILERGDLIVEDVDLVGYVLEKNVDLVNVVPLAIDRKTLIVNIGSGNSHMSSLHQDTDLGSSTFD